MTRLESSRISLINLWLGASLALAALLFITLRYKESLWDFYCYYGAGKAFELGLDPYRTNVFNQMYREFGFSVGPHAYPPLTLWLFRPLTFLHPVAAAVLWNTLKAGTLCSTFIIIQRKFFRWSEIPYAIPFFIFAFNAAIYYDLATGNISLFEQTLIWLALACLIDDRPIWFAVIIALTAQIKIPPVLLLVLLLFYDRRPRWIIFFSALAGTYAIFLLNRIFYPEFTQEFLFAAGQLTDESGVISASSFTFIRAMTDLIRHYGISLPLKIDRWIYLVFGGAVNLISLWAIMRYKKRPDFDRRVLIFFVLVAYGLVLPRIKPYQYAIMIFPTLFLINKFPNYLTWTVVLTLALFPLPGTPLPGPIQKSLVVILDYFTVFALFVVWIGYARFLTLRDAHSLVRSADKYKPPTELFTH